MPMDVLRYGRAIWANDSTTETSDGAIDAVACEDRFLEEVLGIREEHRVMTSIS